MQYIAENISKVVKTPGEDLTILHSLNLQIAAGQSLAVVGSSGSGKSTLLHILGALDTPSEGKVFFEGKDIAALSAAAKANFRNKELGFVFQFHHLLPEFSVLENVAMQGIIGGTARKTALDMAADMLKQVGLEQRASHRVTTLSGGERQRVAIARAVLQKPKVLLADEPTGNLDQGTGLMIVELLQELNKTQNMTLVMVTHNRELAIRMDRCLELKTGELYEQSCI